MRSIQITQEFLDERYKRAKKVGFDRKAKWIEFCEYFLSLNYTVYLYEAKETYSKYITVKRKNKQFKVRFSDHKPILTKEAHKDCDFFVGVTNFQISNTDDAIKATIKALL